MIAALLIVLAQTQIVDGDRVVLLGNGFVERDAEWGHLEGALVRRLAGKRVSFRNLGWSGDAVDAQLRPNGFPRLETWLQDLNPTVILAAFGMNESFQGAAGLEPFKKSLEALLDRIAVTKAKVVLLSPIRHEDLGRPLPDPTEHNRMLALYVEALRGAATRRALPFVDLFSLEGTKAHPLTENGIHLNPHGYARAADAIAAQLSFAAPKWSVEIDASGKVVRSSGAESLPGLLDSLRVVGRGLEGRATLKIDGVKVATHSAEAWAAGVEISRGPAFDREETMRRLIVKKNQLYFFRFRPQNMEYIYGTRSRAEGANVGNPQFASEFRQLEAQVAELETEIQKLATPAPSTYEFVKE